MTTTIDPADVREGSVLIGPNGNLFVVDSMGRSGSIRLVSELSPLRTMPIRLSDCRPVPLSEAVLKACGFEVNEAIAWIEGKPYNFVMHFEAVKPQMKNYIDGQWHPCESLHDLQNIYRTRAKKDLHIDLAKLKEATC